MKRSFDQSFGHKQSAFQPFSRPQNLDRQINAATLADDTATVRPVMRTIAQRPLIHVVWPSAPDSHASVPPQLPPAATSTGVAKANSTQTLIAQTAGELHAAIRANDKEVIQDILNGPGASEIAMVVNRKGENALFHAILKSDTFTQDLLLNLSSGNEMAMQKSKEGLLPLSLAAKKGSLVSVAMLLGLSSAREQVLASHETKESKTFSNPLALAAGYGHELTVRFLLRSPYGRFLAMGSDLTGANSLVLAALQGRAKVVKTLLNSIHGAELVQAKGVFGENALTSAAYGGHKEVVQLLLDYGFVECQLAPQGQLGEALDIALAAGHQEVADLLRRYGAVCFVGNVGNSSSANITPGQ